MLSWAGLGSAGSCAHGTLGASAAPVSARAAPARSHSSSSFKRNHNLQHHHQQHNSFGSSFFVGRCTPPQQRQRQHLTTETPSRRDSSSSTYSGNTATSSSSSSSSSSSRRCLCSSFFHAAAADVGSITTTTSSSSSDSDFDADDHVLTTRSYSSAPSTSTNNNNTVVAPRRARRQRRIGRRRFSAIISRATQTTPIHPTDEPVDYTSLGNTATRQLQVQPQKTTSTTAKSKTTKVKTSKNGNGHGSTKNKFLQNKTKQRSVPFFVMLPLDAVTNDNKLANPHALQAGARALKASGVHGVTVDLWWGIVERDEPRKYNFSAYLALAKLMEAEGLELSVALSFHTCGCNVGDSCSIPLPRWVEEACEKDPDLMYTDENGHRSGEYLSLGADLVPALGGRTPVECYADLANAFRRAFRKYLGRVITEVSVGLGPAGELRYPSYPEPLWTFPGVGAFQCYDTYMVANLRAAAYTVGKPEWRHGGPHDGGGYNARPEETGFFDETYGRYDTDYGRFFTAWYAQALVAHADRVVKAVRSSFAPEDGVTLSIKVPGVHWWAGTRARAAETTAGLHASGRPVNDGIYEDIISMCQRTGTRFIFTCLEMSDDEQPCHAGCAPEALLRRVTRAAWTRNVSIGAENALPRYDPIAHERMVARMYGECLGATEPPEGWRLSNFTFLRMSEAMFRTENWKRFSSFVRQAAEPPKAEALKSADDLADEIGADSGSLKQQEELAESAYAGWVSSPFV